MLKNAQGKYEFTYGHDDEAAAKYNDNMNNIQNKLLPDTQTEEEIKEIVQEEYQECLPLTDSFLKNFSEVLRSEFPSAIKEEKEEIAKNNPLILKIAIIENLGSKHKTFGFPIDFENELNLNFTHNELLFEEGKINIRDPADSKKSIFIQKGEGEMQFYGNKGMESEIAQAAKIYKSTLKGNPSLRCEIEMTDDWQAGEILLSLNTICGHYFPKAESFQTKPIQDPQISQKMVETKNKSRARKQTIEDMKKQLREKEDLIKKLEEAQKALSNLQQAGATTITEDPKTWEPALLSLYNKKGTIPTPIEVSQFAMQNKLIGIPNQEFRRFALRMKYPDKK